MWVILVMSQLRFLELAYWTLDVGGLPLVDAIANTITWREEIGAHSIPEEEVRIPTGSTRVEVSTVVLIFPWTFGPPSMQNT